MYKNKTGETMLDGPLHLSLRCVLHARLIHLLTSLLFFFEEIYVNLVLSETSVPDVSVTCQYIDPLPEHSLF